MNLQESNLCFEFDGTFRAIKFDDTKFYRKKFQLLPDGKGVDFLAKNERTFLLVEVKNCKGHESDNRWRIAPDNRKCSTAPTTVDTTNRVSFDVEISQKVTMTLACLIGVHTQPEYQNHSDELKEYSEALRSLNFSQSTNEIKILFLLEGDFSTRTRPQKLIMKALCDSIKRKLSWLNCSILVENIEEHQKHERYFKVCGV